MNKSSNKSSAISAARSELKVNAAQCREAFRDAFENPCAANVSHLSATLQTRKSLLAALDIEIEKSKIEKSKIEKSKK